MNCEDPLALPFCLSLSTIVTSFPALVYYKGFDGPKAWSPTVLHGGRQGNGTVEGYYELLLDFVEGTLGKTGICSADEMVNCGDVDKEAIRSHVEGGREGIDMSFEEIVGRIEVERGRKIREIAKMGDGWGREDEVSLTGG